MSTGQHAPEADWLTGFEPVALLRGGHAQTLAGNYWRRKPFNLQSHPEVVEVDPADGSRILCHCHWQPEPLRARRLTLLLVHGLEGSSSSRYIEGITALAWNAGCNVIRMNMRNCGGTETWTRTLYHSGLSADVYAVLQHFVTMYGFERVAMAGYSMGGNLVLKLAGELADQAPAWLLAAVGVCPAADLAASADALHEPANRMYERHFLRNLMRRFRSKVKLYPEIYSEKGLGPVRSVREFDDRITARHSGFADADDYYFRASSGRLVSRIGIPTLIVHALDDPFIRMTPETREASILNPAIAFVETTHGGHCAFLAKRTSSSGTLSGEKYAVVAQSRHWAEATLVRFLLSNAERVNGG